MTPKVPFAMAVLLGCTALAGNAHAGWFDFGSKPAAAPASKDGKDAKPADTQPAANLDDSIRQAQMLRLAGQYPEAIKYLSQLMLVASDDPRVVSEYGKTLASMGRANEAINFLTRAQQLQPGDWTVYSALGVAYDETGNQKDAQANYERALALKPDEASVLNNYALSRLLAKDTETAGKLATRAEIANAAAKDDKIVRNIAMIRSVASEAAASTVAANPAPALPAPAKPAPLVPVARNPVPLPPASASPVAANPVPAKPQTAASQTGVVMQRVPVDPLAGPVASRAPRPLQAPSNVKAALSANTKPSIPAAQAGPQVSMAIKAQDVKPLSAKPLPPMPVKAAAPQKAAAKPKDEIPGLRMSANAY